MGVKIVPDRRDVQAMEVEIDKLENQVTTYRNSTVESVREALKRVRAQKYFSKLSGMNTVRCNYRKQDLKELLKQIHVARDRAITESGRLPKDLAELLITFFYFPPRSVDEVKQEIDAVLDERNALMGRIPTIDAIRRVELETGPPQSSNEEALRQLSTRLNTLKDELDEVNRFDPSYHVLF